MIQMIPAVIDLRRRTIKQKQEQHKGKGKKLEKNSVTTGLEASLGTNWACSPFGWVFVYEWVTSRTDVSAIWDVYTSAADTDDTTMFSIIINPTTVP